MGLKLFLQLYALFQEGFPAVLSPCIWATGDESLKPNRRRQPETQSEASVANGTNSPSSLRTPLPSPCPVRLTDEWEPMAEP